MKRLLALAFLVSLVSAQSPGLESALQNLCQMSQAFMGLLAMLLIITGPATIVLGFAIMLFAKGKHKIAELVGKIIFGLGALLLAGGILAVLLYILTPFIITQLLSGSIENGIDPCGFG